MISRGMIFNSLSIIYGVYKFSKKIGKFLKIQFFIKMIIFCGILFYISIILVNEIRAKYFYIGKSRIDTSKTINVSINKNSFNFLNNNSEIFYIATNRWVGIDAILAVVQNKDKLGAPLLREAFNESFQKKSPTFYEKNFYLKGAKDSTININENVKGNTLTGIIAFLFYSGSLTFLFIGMFILIVFANIIEFISFKLSGSFKISKALALCGSLRIKPLSSRPVIKRWIPDLDLRSKASRISSKEGDTPDSLNLQSIKVINSYCFLVSISPSPNIASHLPQQSRNYLEYIEYVFYITRWEQNNNHFCSTLVLIEGQ